MLEDGDIDGKEAALGLESYYNEELSRSESADGKIKDVLRYVACYRPIYFVPTNQVVIIFVLPRTGCYP